MKYADLHVHTNFSDSTFSPEEVMAAAKDKGLSAIAICDHDCIDGIAPCAAMSAALGVEVIPGIELTVEKLDAEIHMLGYFLDWRQPRLQKRLLQLQGFRVDRIRRMVEKLDGEGLKIDPEDVFRLSGKGSVGRMHLARALLAAGKIKTLKEAFNKYIGFMKPCYVSNIRFTPQEAVEMILKAGGVPVLAHPGITGKDGYIDELVEYGLRGIEVYHTDHNPRAVRHYEELAAVKGLLVTGGSDCHGMGKGKVLMGSVRVPYDIVDKLREESERIRREYR